MITTRHMTVEAELIRWLLLMIAAAALVLALATALVAADPLTEPGWLPADMGEAAKPILANPVQPYFPEAPPAREYPPAEAAARLWTILDHQRNGRVAEALAGWEQLRLPDETAYWADIAMGATYLQAGDADAAAIHLNMARQIAPYHPVVAYYMGILRMEQAAAVTRVPDEPVGNIMRFVATTPKEEQAIFELLAMQELQAAIAGAADVRLDERLVQVDPTIEETIVVPHVADLLAALQADNFVGKAHHLLFGLKLDRGELIEAELHLDMAATTGLATLYGYRDLAEAYLMAERQPDAIRVLEKDLIANHGWLLRACQQAEDRAYAATKAMWVW